jgi:hypothetical protein
MPGHWNENFSRYREPSPNCGRDNNGEIMNDFHNYSEESSKVVKKPIKKSVKKPKPKSKTKVKLTINKRLERIEKLLKKYFINV